MEVSKIRSLKRGHQQRCSLSTLLLLLVAGGALLALASTPAAAASKATASGKLAANKAEGANQRGVASVAATAENPKKANDEADREVGLESNIANAKVQMSSQDMATAAGHHHGKSHGKYYMFVEAPKKKTYKMGFKRGNHKHHIEMKESRHKSHDHGYFKWHDKKGKGSHKWEYKHEGKKKGHY